MSYQIDHRDQERQFIVGKDFLVEKSLVKSVTIDGAGRLLFTLHDGHQVTGTMGKPLDEIAVVAGMLMPELIVMPDGDRFGFHAAAKRLGDVREYRAVVPGKPTAAE